MPFLLVVGNFTAVVDNADITKAVKDFKIVDLRIMNSPNSSPLKGIQFQSLYYTILYRIPLSCCMKGTCNL